MSGIAAAVATADQVADAQATLERFRAALEADPSDTDALLGIARLLELGGEPLEALRWSRRALAVERSPKALDTVARLAARLGRTEEALELFAELRKSAPRQPGAYLLPAILLRDDGRESEALTLLEEARSLGVQDAAIDLQAALLVLSEGEPARARELALGAWQAGRRSADLAAVIGLAWAEEGGHAEAAVEWLERALEQGTDQRGSRPVGARRSAAGARPAPSSAR